MRMSESKLRLWDPGSLHLLTPTHVALSRHPTLAGRADGLLCRVPLDLRHVGARRRCVEHLILELRHDGGGPGQSLLWAREVGEWDDSSVGLIERLEAWPAADAEGPPEDFPAFRAFPAFAAEADSRRVWIGEFHADAPVAPLTVEEPYQLTIFARLRDEPGPRQILSVIEVAFTPAVLTAIAVGIRAIPCIGVQEED